MAKKIYKLELANNQVLEVETGRLAQQADGSALVSIGGTTVLSTFCVTREPQNLDFLPLSISYSEKFYASGMMKHSKVNKREGRPSDDNILSARVIDRTNRPMFPKGFNHGAQVMLSVMSYDGENPHDIVAGIGASVALSLSKAPFMGPTSMLRVGMIDNEFILNPTEEQKEKSDLDLIVSCTKEAVIMIESIANEVSENTMIKAIEFGFENGKKVCEFIEKIMQEENVQKMDFVKEEVNSNILPLIKKLYQDKITETIFNNDLDKKERFRRFDDLKKEASLEITEKLNEGKTEEDEDFVSEKEVVNVFDKQMKDTIRYSILKEEKRIKGRKLDEIRPLNCEVDILKCTHGSALFNRGETQALSIVTLAGPDNKLYKVGIEGEKQERYFHHYNFPPYSVGEVSTRLFTGNREIGHGALGEKALKPVLPDEKDFPYTIRVVTEILSSNGSSSMASACGSTLALMSAGVPLKAPVAGIAMGLMSDPETGDFKVLTDLQDEEDFGGDMDFKVAGTEKGITAIQMDIKVKGISLDIFKEAFEKARLGRLKILDAMLNVISEPRKQVSDYAPRIESLQIDTDKIRDVIGKGGETINKIIDETGVSIDISENGLVSVTGGKGTDMEKALKTIKDLTQNYLVGNMYEGTVKKILDFGVVVSISPNKDGLVHISAMSKKHVKHPSDLVKEGQIVNVKITEIEANGKCRLSMIF